MVPGTGIPRDPAGIPIPPFPGNDFSRPGKFFLNVRVLAINAAFYHIKKSTHIFKKRKNAYFQIIFSHVVKAYQLKQTVTFEKKTEKQNTIPKRPMNSIGTCLLYTSPSPRDRG